MQYFTVYINNLARAFTIERVETFDFDKSPEGSIELEHPDGIRALLDYGAVTFYWGDQEARSLLDNYILTLIEKLDVWDMGRKETYPYRADILIPIQPMKVNDIVLFEHFVARAQDLLRQSELLILIEPLSGTLKPKTLH